MRNRIAVIAVVTSALSMAACLEKETTHALYLSPGGQVAWTVLEQNVRSDKENAAEESEYLASALAGTSDVARGLDALEASRVQTRVLRRERPFTVMVEARFPSVEALAKQIMAECRLNGDAYLTSENGTVTLHIHLDFRGPEPESGNDSPVEAMLESIDSYRIVLTEGRFVEAVGFTLNGDQTIAAPIGVSEEEIDAMGGVLELSLTWRVS